MATLLREETQRGRLWLVVALSWTLIIGVASYPESKSVGTLWQTGTWMWLPEHKAKRLSMFKEKPRGSEPEHQNLIGNRGLEEGLEVRNVEAGD